MPDPRTVFIVSDHTGLTAENIAKALLVHFPNQRFNYEMRPFVKDEAAVQGVLAEIAEVAARQPQPLLFHTFTNPQLTALLNNADAEVFDLLSYGIRKVSKMLGAEPDLFAGGLHDMKDSERYTSRIEALEFALNTDDGVGGKQYGTADVILVAVSRAGKTPTSFHLALQHGVRASNYPLTDEDLVNDTLPPMLEKHRSKLFGLTIDPRRLHLIRQQRRPGSDYASLENCEREVRHAEKMFRRYGIPTRDTTASSVEEISASILAMRREMQNRKE